VIQTFHRAFASTHDLSDLSIGKVLDEFEDEQGLSFGRQTSDEFEKRAFLLRTDEVSFRMVALGRQDGQFIQWDFLPAAPVTVPVGDQIVSDAVQPCGEWNASIPVILDVIHRPLKDAGSQVLRVVEVAGAVVHIIEDAVYVLLVELTEGVAVANGRASQNIIFTEFQIRQEKFLPAGLNIITPPGFRSCREYNMQHFNFIGAACPALYNQSLQNFRQQENINVVVRINETNVL